MDILLVSSIDYQVVSAKPQIGQLIIKDILKEKYSVELVSFDYLAKNKVITFKDTIWENISMFSDYIIDKNPKIVGFYTICDSFMTTMLLAKEIKKRKQDIKILFGGPHATLTAKECLTDFDFIDVISLGESEKTIMPTVDALMRDNDFTNIKGVAYKRNGEIFLNEREALISNEELIYYTPFDYTPFTISADMEIGIEAGRGCPFGCTFCSTSPFWGRHFRIKAVDEIIGEMKKFNQIYGVTKFALVHDMFTANRKHLTEFCNRMIEEELPFIWGCSSRVDVLDKELLALMKKAHCISIYLGIETGSESMQKKVNKNLNLEYAITMIKEIHKLDMACTSSFIYGYPEESIEEFQDTIRFMEDIIVNAERTVQLHRFMLLPHTVETEKMYGKVRFDESDVDFSIYDEKLYDEEAKNIIRKYPKQFIQFYTFDTEVRKKYKYFDSYLYYLLSAMGIYQCSIRYLIRKYGLEELYFMYLDKIQEVYTNIRKMDIVSGSEVDSTMPEVYKFIQYMFEDELTKCYTEELDQFIKYEDLLLEYSEQEGEEPKYYRVPFDVMKAKKENVYEENECTIKFYYKRHIIKVSKVKIEEYCSSAAIV